MKKKNLFSILFLLGSFLTIYAQDSITFRVNFKQAIIENQFSESAGDIVVVRGNFEGWQSNKYRLTDKNNDTVYTGKFLFNMVPDSIIEYKFCIIKNSGEVYWEWYPDPENIPHGNRQLLLTGKPQKLTVTNFHLINSIVPDNNGKIIFSTEELTGDFLQLRGSLEELHCALYEYTSQEVFDSLFECQFNQINEPMEYNEFYNLVNPLLVRVGCMHTGIWMPGEFWNLGTDNFFPLQLRLIEGNAVVAGYYNDTAQVPIGSTILKINSRPIGEIIEDVKNSIISDAINMQFQRAGFEKRFPLAYGSIYGFPEEYFIAYLLPGQKIKSTAKLIPANEESVRKIVYKNFNHPSLTLKFLEQKNLAILKIPTFSYYDRVEYFTSFIDSSFQEIKNRNITNLILDLRGNDGGDPFCSVPLFSYLEKEPVKYFAKESGRYSEFFKLIPLAENHFTGNLYTLIDQHCGSTNGHFSSLLKYHKIGKFVGVEGGATYKCNARVEEFLLKNTRLIVNVARQTFIAAVEGMDKTKGVETDYFVEQTYADFLNGKDTALEYTLKLIEEQ